MGRPLTASRGSGPLTIVVAILVALTVSACGGSSNDKTVTKTESATTDTTATTTTTPSAVSQYTSTVPAATPVNPVLNQVAIGQFFSASSPWNTPVENLDTDPRSPRMMKLAELRSATIEEPDGRLRKTFRRIKAGLTINVRRWTDPIFSDQGGVEVQAQCRQLDCGPDAVSSIVMPADAAPEPRFDGWMTVVLTGQRVAYDFWRGRRLENGILSYQFDKKWDLNGPGFQSPGNVSARGSGLPLFAGIIRPEDIRSGQINHALAISIPGAARNRYVQPASSTDGNGPFASVPEGARLRLKTDFKVRIDNRLAKNRAERRAANMILTALSRYGAIVVDRSAAPTLYAQRNANWKRILPLNALQNIPLRDFEVVRLPDKVYNVDKPPNVEALGANGLPQSAPGSPPSGVPGVG